MTNREFAEKHGITKRAASKVRLARQRNNPKSPFFGLTLAEDIAKRVK